MSAVVHSINVCAEGGVPKHPVSAARIHVEGLEGDYNVFRTERRGSTSSRAVSLFSLERIGQLEAEGHPISVGSTGENITIEGLNWSSLKVGMHVKVGAAVLELSEPCAPCTKIGESFIDGRFARIDHEQEFGWSRWLACVLEEGMVATGDRVTVLNPGED